MKWNAHSTTPTFALIFTWTEYLKRGQSFDGVGGGSGSEGVSKLHDAMRVLAVAVRKNERWVPPNEYSCNEIKFIQNIWYIFLKGGTNVDDTATVEGDLSDEIDCLLLLQYLKR